MEELVAALRHQRHLMERLLFRLTTLRLLLESGDDRFTTWACDEVHRVVDELRRAEGGRGRPLTAPSLADTDEMSLAELARTSPEPYGFILRDHLEALDGLIGSIAAEATAAAFPASSMAADPEERVVDLVSAERKLTRAYSDFSVRQATTEASDAALSQLERLLS